MRGARGSRVTKIDEPIRDTAAIQASKRFAQVGVSVSPEKYRSLIAGTKDKCPICRKSGSKIVLDHDHKTGEIRSPICNSCNLILGLAKDSPETLIQAATYLKTKGKVFMNIVTKEQRNKKGIYTRPVFVKHLELEYWDMIHEVMKDNPELKTYADTLRFMAKRATGRI